MPRNLSSLPPFDITSITLDIEDKLKISTSEENREQVEELIRNIEEKKMEAESEPDNQLTTSPCPWWYNIVERVMSISVPSMLIVCDKYNDKYQFECENDINTLKDCINDSSDPLEISDAIAKQMMSFFEEHAPSEVNDLATMLKYHKQLRSLFEALYSFVDYKNSRCRRGAIE